MRLGVIGRRSAVVAAVAFGVVAAVWSVHAGEASAPASMIHVPGGRVFIGLRPGKGPDGIETGKLEELRPFWIDKTEVTAGQYQQCVQAKKCRPTAAHAKVCNVDAKRLNHPMNCVDWNGADAYCRWAGKRLPTEAEWERAARGDDERPYPWGTAPPADQLCWDRGQETRKTTCAVGSFPGGASPYGALDMAGNVAEWTSSPHGKGRTYKGGGFFVEPLAMSAPDWLDFRTENGSWHAATFAAPDLGFRCARDEASDGGVAAPPTDAAVTITRPAPGSPERKALLDAVRAKLSVTSEFKVSLLAIAGEWAYFEGQEHNSTARLAAALLHRSGGSWTAEDAAFVENKDALPKFRDRLQSDAARRLPAALFKP